MNIEPIIYQTTRGIYSVEDKLSIASLILFCWKLGTPEFSELLYTKKHELFISDLNKRFEKYDINLWVNLNDKNIKDAFLKTIEKVKEKYDTKGFYKAVFEKDPFAMVIIEITNTKFDKKEAGIIAYNISQQLTLI